MRIFGRAIGMKHRPGRDDATDEDIALRGWKAKWPRYFRVHHAEFVAGTMSNGVSLNEMMAMLGPNSFRPTQRNAAQVSGNTDPRKAYRQQAAVELSDEGCSGLASGFSQPSMRTTRCRKIRSTVSTGGSFRSVEQANASGYSVAIAVLAGM